MKSFFAIAVIFLLLTGTAYGQVVSCQTQVDTAAAMIDEYQEQMRSMSRRAAAYYGRMQGFLKKLNAAQAEIARLKEKK
ncbi:MAG: hypothetical protein V3S55_06400 [Nitrospiraceae bacterium]